MGCNPRCKLPDGLPIDREKMHRFCYSNVDVIVCAGWCQWCDEYQRKVFVHRRGCNGGTAIICERCAEQIAAACKAAP